jgi:hypothetical protein
MKVYREEYPNLPQEHLEISRDQILSELENKRHKVIVNCWHMNDSESAAMWNLYTKHECGWGSNQNYIYEIVRQLG